MAFTVDFQNRNFSGVSFTGLSFIINRYSHNVIGGPKEASITAYGSQEDIVSLIETLRYSVTIYNDTPEPVWWGIISGVEIRVGWYGVNVTLDEMANKILVSYIKWGEAKDSSWQQNEISIGTYGTKELKLSLSDAEDEEAKQYVRVELDAKKYPIPELQMQAQGEGGLSATIHCTGWFETLSWIYYNQPKGIEGNFKTTQGQQRVGCKVKDNTISFIAASTITHSGSLLMNFAAGDKLRVMGATGNNGDWTIESVDSSGGSLEVDISSASLVTIASGTVFELSTGSRIRQVAVYNFSGSDWAARSIQVLVQSYIASSTFQTADNLKATLYRDFTGASIASGSLAASLISTSAVEWHEIELSSSVMFSTSNGAHWLYLERTNPCPQNASSYYIIGIDEEKSYHPYGALQIQSGSPSSFAYRQPRADLNFRIIGTQETTEQITEIIRTSGQFINAIDVPISSSVYTHQYRDGSKTAIDEIKAIMEAGTKNNRRLLAYVDVDRRLKVYEEPVYNSDFIYTLKSDRRLYTPGWADVDRSKCIVGMYVSLTDMFPQQPGRLARFSEFFVEEAEYYTESDVYLPRSKNSRNPWLIGIEKG